MKVSAIAEAVEVEVDISLEDIVCAIAEDTDSAHTVMRGISNCHRFLKAIPAETIAAMTDKQCETIHTALLEQVQRYARTSEGNDRG